MRVLQIGCGAFGAVHARAWSMLGLASGLTLADRDPSRAVAALAQAEGARAVVDWSEALAEADIIDLVTPADTHHAIAVAVLDAGKPLLIEKPAALTAEDARDLAARAERAGIPVQVGLILRWHPVVQALRQLVHQGRLGRLHHASGRMVSLKRLREDCGTLENDAVHLIDLVLSLFGERVRRVDAVLRDDLGCGRDQHAVLLLRFAGGASAVIETGCDMPGGTPDPFVPGTFATRHVLIAGSEAVAELDLGAGRLAMRRGRLESRNGLHIPAFLEEEVVAEARPEPVDLVAASFRHFLAVLRGATRPIAPLAECGVAIAEVFDAARLAARHA